ncbi:hypothetical protein FHETE_9364 [Fusarium heterosporum]|uniref:Uncharacterized protein n=1 Tax=Fusarium heterosporum TaxID=42747 RepID=A0A8H5SZ04_FUSHE|nr:hypothetical protein FHETE_9364 [Fusarium heterosporum]
MDPFANLPPEIQATIFAHLSSTTTKLQLIQASPCMLAQYLECQASTMGDWLVNLLSGNRYEDIIQDAMAIIHLDMTAIAPDNHVIAYHIRQWESKSYPDPIQRNDRNIILKLHSFFSRIVMLIEDYISKATSEHAPMAYIQLPKVSLAATGLRWSPECPALDQKTLDVLTSIERHRLIWAFIKFEILCNFYHPRTYDIGHTDWHNDLPRTSQSELNTWEKEALHCVYEYINSVYSTLFANCYRIRRQNFKIPCGDLSLNLGCHYFDPVDCCAHRPSWLVKGLPYLGFDLLVHLLDHADSTRYLTCMKQWFYWMSREWEITVRTTGLDFHLCSSPPNFNDDSTSQGQPEYALQKRLVSYFGETLFEDDSNERYALRQRGWVFFESFRLFPQDSTFLSAIFHSRFVDEAHFHGNQHYQDHTLEGASRLSPPIPDVRREVPRCFEYANSRVLTTFWRHLSAVG